MTSFIGCSLEYNKVVFLGPYDECGYIDIFKPWRDEVSEEKARPIIKHFMLHYELPLFHVIGNSSESINSFF